MIVPAACLLVPFLVPPLLALTQLRAGAPARALGAVVSTTATIGLYAPILLLAGLFGRPPLWGGGALWQGSLLLAIATFWTLWVRARQAVEAGWPGQATGGCLPALGLSVVCLLTGAFFEFVMIGHWARQTANETSTVFMLRTIGKAAAAHAEKTRCGYPETPATLDVEEAELAARMRAGPTFLRNSYRIEYHAGPRVRNAAGACPGGVESFVVTARPLTWGVDGRSSFRTDATAAIHYTSRDRPATVEDPIVGR
jgi:hypothetical protein